MEKCGKDIIKAANIINDGGLVIFPTETVYGLGANALDKNAVQKIFDVKERPTFDPLIVHIDSIDRIFSVVSSFPDIAVKLANNFWPGPLTMILPKNPNIPDLVTSGLDSVGVRIPEHPDTLEFLKKANKPVAGPSANKFGYISPTKTSHLHDLIEGVDYIIDGGDCSIGIESTIISLVNKPTILRKGKITQEEIENIIGKINVNINSSSRPEAPGMLEKHYAPKTKLEIFDSKKVYCGKTAFIAFGNNTPNVKFDKIVNLSIDGDYYEAAENLYTVLRDLDSECYDIILTSLLPDLIIGDAINDKLKRASA